MPFARFGRYIFVKDGQIGRGLETLGLTCHASTPTKPSAQARRRRGTSTTTNQGGNQVGIGGGLECWFFLGAACRAVDEASSLLVSSSPIIELLGLSA